MPKCRPNLDKESNLTPTELKAPGNRRKAAESGKASTTHRRLHLDAAPVDIDSVSHAFDRHAALLDDSRLYSSANGIERAMIVRKLQRNHGTGYVQRLIEHISPRRTTQVQAKFTAGPA